MELVPLWIGIVTGVLAFAAEGRKPSAARWSA
jgi:hypothetical protein